MTQAKRSSSLLEAVKTAVWERVGIAFSDDSARHVVDATLSALRHEEDADEVDNMTYIVERLHAYLASDLDTLDDAARERDAMIAEAADEIERLQTETRKLRAAAERVCWFDWSADNDPDAVAAVDQLRRDIEQNPPKPELYLKAAVDEIKRLPWRCLVTGNPVGTDTQMIGAPSCQCQVCRAADEIGRLRAKLAEYESVPVRLRHILRTGTMPPDDMK